MLFCKSHAKSDDMVVPSQLAAFAAWKTKSVEQSSVI